jgi:hypothetical protein
MKAGGVQELLAGRGGREADARVLTDVLRTEHGSAREKKDRELENFRDLSQTRANRKEASDDSNEHGR